MTKANARKFLREIPQRSDKEAHEEYYCKDPWSGVYYGYQSSTNRWYHYVGDKELHTLWDGPWRPFEVDMTEQEWVENKELREVSRLEVLVVCGSLPEWGEEEQQK